MRMRFMAIAKGSQPAVVKMASYGGGVRLGAMMNYVSRSGEVEVEDDRGERIRSRDRLSSLRNEWEHLFQNREESRDIGVFSITMGSVPDCSSEELHALVGAALTRGLGERRFAYGIACHDDASLAVSGVVVLRNADGERLTGDAKAARIVQERYDGRSTSDDPTAVFSFNGYGNGVDYGTARLRRLVATFEGDVHDERGIMIENDGVAGDLVQKDWRHELHSRKSRDVMHLIMSARAGTDVDAFKDAARDFLAEQFPGHRYVFAMHDPTEDPKAEAEGGKRPHVHAHAIITMKSEFGERIETSPQVFRQWRSLMAEKAREHGIDMEMTDRRELATAPAFGRNQVRPVSRLGRTEHVGTSEAAHARYAAKRSERATVARARRSIEYTEMARQTWGNLMRLRDDYDVAAFAKIQENRLGTAFPHHDLSASLDVASANFGSKYVANMVWLRAIVLEADELREMSRPEFEAYEKRVETALFRFERLVVPEERADFDEIAVAAREHVNVRREILELNEERRTQEIDGKDRNIQRAGDPLGRGDADTEARDTINNLDTARHRIERAEAEGQIGEEAKLEYDAALNTAARLATAASSANAGEDERPHADDNAIDRDAGHLDDRTDLEYNRRSPANEQKRFQSPEHGRDAALRYGKADRNDPQKQHVRSLDELDGEEHEEQERKDRDRDGLER